MGIFQQFPYSNFHEMNLDQIIKIMREMQDEWEATKAEWASYKDFIDNYFANLNLDEETEKALRALIADGTLSPVIDPVIAAETAAWLADHITQPTTPAIDTTLSVPGAAADAKSTGDAVKLVQSDYDLQAYALAQTMITNLINTSLYEDGYYAHNNPSSIGSANCKHLPPIRIVAGLKYTFYGVYGYFCTIVYDDGSKEALSNSASPATISATLDPVKNGYAYITVNNNWYDTAMVNEANFNFQGKHLTGVYGALTIRPNTISPSNYSLILPTLSDAEDNKIYNIVTTAAMTNSPGTMTDVPDILTSGQHVVTLANIGTSLTAGCTQILIVPEYSTIDTKSVIYTRYCKEVGGTPTWMPWTSAGEQKVVTVAADGSGDFTSFTEGLLEATKQRGSRVYVMPGTYDIISEYETLYGVGFFSSYDDQTADHGPRLWNDVEVICCPNAYITCNYSGNNTYVQNLFSPLNSGSFGFTLVNANVESSNVRYSLHDERGQQTDFYHNKLIGCNLKHDKAGGSGYHQALGGGLGKNGLVEIDNCTFESVSSIGNIVSYHNTVVDDARSQIMIRNSIIKGGVRFSYYGVSPLVSTMFVNGCKMKTAPVVTQESSSYNTVNVEIEDWNNLITG